MFTTQYGLDILKQANKLVLPSVDIMDDAKMSIYDTLTQFEFIVGVYFAANGMITSFNPTKSCKSFLSLTSPNSN